MKQPVIIDGYHDLDRKLRTLGRSGSKKAIRSGINAGLTPIGKAMRSAINATEGVSPELKRAARKSIGKRFRKSRRGISKGEYEAKVGFSVGKKQAGGTDRSHGVGVNARNIHWFVLGTEQRHQKSTGRATGRIVPVFGEVTRAAFAGSEQAALAAARKKITQVINREARKRG